MKHNYKLALTAIALSFVLAHCGSGFTPPDNALSADVSAQDSDLYDDELDSGTALQDEPGESSLNSDMQALVSSTSITDIAGTQYETEIRAVLDAGFWPLATGTKLFYPNKNTTLSEMLTVVLKGSNLYATAGKFVGGQCPGSPFLSYAISKGIVVTSTCPSMTSQRTVAQMVDASARAFKLMGSAYADYFNEMVSTYDGPSVGSVSRPYGIGKSNFKFAYMIGALAGWTNTNNPADSTYGTGIIRRGQTAAFVYRILMYDVGAPTPTPVPTPTPTGSWWKPTVGTTWQVQFSGLLDTSFNVNMYDVDLFDTPQSTIDGLRARGIKVVCYFSAGSSENWRPDYSQFTSAVKGNSNGWAGENWLDIRNLTVLGPIMKARFDLAKSKKCDGIDTDNVDGFTNSTGFPLTSNDQLVYNRFLSTEAHARGLAIGLKNDLLQIKDLVSSYDFSFNEQCHVYNECYYLTPFIQAGKPVFGLEYSLSASQVCPDSNANKFSTLVKNQSLDAYSLPCWSY